MRVLVLVPAHLEGTSSIGDRLEPGAGLSSAHPLPKGLPALTGLGRSCQAAGTAHACPVLVRVLPGPGMGHGQGGLCTNREKNHRFSLRGSANGERELCGKPGAAHRLGIKVCTAAWGAVKR